MAAPGLRQNSMFKASPRSHRRGVAVVEFAICVPILVLLVFGSIEAANYIFLKQSLQIAAYEGIREATRSTATNASAKRAADGILNSRKIKGSNVSFPSGNVASASRGDQVVIVVNADANINSPLAGKFVPNRKLSARVVMLKE